MNDFKGFSRDTSIVKTPSDMWQQACNILLSNKYLSVSNEKGNEYIYEIPGIVIGFEITNEDIVYLSIDGEFTCIGYVNYRNQIYKPVIRTNNPSFKFNLNSPIECISVYNYKKELVILFSDGVNQNSSTPKLINIHNPQKALSTSYDFINPNDYLAFELFTQNELPVINTRYEKGSLDVEVVHIALSYIYNDNTEGLPTPIIKTVYPNFKNKDKIKRNVIIELSNLSSIFDKVKLLFIVKENNSTTAYESPILTIENNSIRYILSNVSNLTISNVEKVLLNYERFTKIKTITKTANQALIGWTETEDNFDFQKYANMLELKVNLITSPLLLEKYESHPTFLPDEVYSFKIVPIFTNGSRGNAFHIPARKPKQFTIPFSSRVAFENSILTSDEINSYGLNFPEFLGKDYKVFHLENTSSQSNEWAYWENEEKYPNKDIYNSISVGGEDLRNTPIRYHRFPSSNKISEGDSMIPIISNNLEKIEKLPKFIISIDNFNDVVPLDIRNKLQGYEIVFEKRLKGGTYIEFVGVAYNSAFRNGLELVYDDKSQIVVSNVKSFKDFNFISAETAKDRAGVTATIVKMYKGLTIQMPSLDNPFVPGYENPQVTVLNTNETIAKITTKEYKMANNIANNNRFREERLVISTEHKTSTDDSDFIPVSSFSDFAAATVTFNCALITLNKNIYNLENSNDFISVGKYIFNIESGVNDFLINGDVFTNNIISNSFSVYYPFPAHGYIKNYIYNIYSPLSNHLIKIGSAANVRIYYPDYSVYDINQLNTIDYTTVVTNNSNNDYFNDLEPTLSYPLTINYINKFPYRIYKGLVIPNESINTSNLRTFLSNQYYDMPNDKGEITALRGFNNGLFIQQKYSLYKTTISDKLNNDNDNVYLGNTELFDRLPDEFVNNKNIGYIGSNSQFACTVFKDGYATIDEIQGKVFLVTDSATEISLSFNKAFFKKVLPLNNTLYKYDLFGNKTQVDNPYISVGYIIGYDEEYNRLIITKKDYLLKNDFNELENDGEFYKDDEGNLIDFKNTEYFEDKSLTYSYALDSKTWVSPHTYHQNAFIYNNTGIYSIYNIIGQNAKIYKHNSNNVNPSNFNGIQYQSYIDLIFNGRLDINKQYQAVYWVSEVEDMDTGNINQFDTIDSVMIYNNHQCSGILPVSKTNLVTSRNSEGIWQFNEFRDNLNNPNSKILDENGDLLTANIINKQWYNKNIFISNFIVVRMIWNNTDKKLKYIHNVNVKSVTSQR